jgi:hypothetical protein
MTSADHAPSIFKDGHGGEVDIWGVGKLIKDSARFIMHFPPKLVELGEWMQITAPTAETALHHILSCRTDKYGFHLNALYTLF